MEELRISSAAFATPLLPDAVLLVPSLTFLAAKFLTKPDSKVTRMGIKTCIPIRKANDDRSAQFKAARQILSNEMFSKESKLSSSKAKQTVLDLTCPAKRTVTGEPKIVESKMLDTTIASFLYENALWFNVVDSESFAALVDECIEFGRQHPGRKYKPPN